MKYPNISNSDDLILWLQSLNIKLRLCPSCNVLNTVKNKMPKICVCRHCKKKFRAEK